MPPRAVWTWIILILQRHDETRDYIWAERRFCELHHLTVLYARMPSAGEGLWFVGTACSWTLACLKWHLKDSTAITPCSPGQMMTAGLGLFIFSGFLRPQFSPMVKPLCSGSSEKHCHFKSKKEKERWFYSDFLWQTIEQCFRSVEWERVKGRWVQQSRQFLAFCFTRTQGLGFPDGSVGKGFSCRARDKGDVGSIPGLGRSL